MTIRLLNEKTIGKIAAGEVVERPASVAKELLENALDAGATRILIEIRGGGSDLIEVADDGCGIDPGELAMAVQRHATSKLGSFDDLHVLDTLGFRGEALPSIAAVSHLTIRSKVAGEASGAVLTVSYGEVEPSRTTGASVGTTVTVRDLFGNVPARRKFLRQPSTEAAYIGRIVGAYAAAYPRVQFSLTSDGRRVFGTDGAGDQVGAATGVFGRDVSRAALVLEPLDEAAAVPGVAVTGWVAAPSITRSHRQDLVFFVNGRWIQHRSLSYALEEAYHSVLMVSRHPVAVVRIEVDPAAVDVNVHPTKAEVKFVDERAACRAVQRATHMALAKSPRDDLPAVSFRPSSPSGPDQSPRWQQPRFGAELPHPADDEPGSGLIEAGRRSVPMLRVLGQVAATFIIAEGPEGMYLIDQHAAHERVMYEKILGQMDRNGMDRQPLLDPLVVDLTPEQQAAFERSRAELTRIGFEIEPFGDGSVVVRTVPAVVTNVDVAERLLLILQELADGGSGESWLDAVAISAACHTSIRAGQSLSLAEMRELVSELERTSQPRACGHGRPTMLHLTQNELERQFARR
ncbi:MAG: DNA mismatch repair endonuclease MutL [Thermomicrobiales bacterium]